MKINWFKINFYTLKKVITLILVSNSRKIEDLCTLLTQGEICLDCGKYYDWCECEEDYNIENTKKFIINFMIYNLSKYRINYTLRDIYSEKYINKEWQKYLDILEKTVNEN